MKILMGRGSCKITFEENEKYAGRTLLVEGEGDLVGEFDIYKSMIHKMRWQNSNEESNHLEFVDEAIRDEVLSYVLEEANKKEGCSLLLW